MKFKDEFKKEMVRKLLLPSGKGATSLGREIGVTPEQVRKDFSQFGIKGKRKGGYNINELVFTINGIFRKDELQRVILIGMGNIGNAVLQYRGFSKIMIQIVAGFDIDPSKYKKK
ncbi:MAG: hypothetical protein ABUK01_05820, partial [Leptospirales bacterium]